MFINKTMTRSVITISKDTKIFEAQKIMSDKNIRHLPVVEQDKRLIGIVTDRDIRSALPSVVLEDDACIAERKRLGEKSVEMIMTKQPVTITPSYTIQDALLLIQQKNVGAIPVVDEDGILKGIVSIRDLLRAFINVLGIGEPGILVGILVQDKKGEMKKIIDAITEENLSFGSILVAKHWEQGKRAVFPYLLTNTVAPIKRKLKDMGYTLLDPLEWYIDQLPKA